MLAKYEEVYPGAAEIIFKGYQDQARHRQALERIVVGGARRANWGLALGFVIGLCALGVSGYIAALAHPWPGVVFGSTGVAALCGVFVYGRRDQRLERESKASRH